MPLSMGIPYKNTFKERRFCVRVFFFLFFFWGGGGGEGGGGICEFLYLSVLINFRLLHRGRLQPFIQNFSPESGAEYRSDKQSRHARCFTEDVHHGVWDYLINIKENKKILKILPHCRPKQFGEN